MSNALTYPGIEKLLIARFPELNEPMARTFGSYYDLRTETPQAYPLFEDVLQPFLMDLLASPDPTTPVASRIFAFLEQMASSSDLEVVNLLWIAILESLVFDGVAIRKAWAMMGDRTRSLSREVALQRGWQENLPRS